MTFLLEIPNSGDFMLSIFLLLMFGLFALIFIFVFYDTKKHLNEKIKALTDENNALLAKLIEMKNSI